MAANTQTPNHPGTASRSTAPAAAPAPAPPAAPADLIFRALASEPRRRILALLAAKTFGSGAPDCCSSEDDVCACVLVETLGLGAPTISHHMKTLTDAGLVSSEKRGTWVHYRLNPDGMERLLLELRSLGAPVNPAPAPAPVNPAPAPAPATPASATPAPVALEGAPRS